MRNICLFIAFLGYALSAESQESQIRNLIDKMFESMIQKDTMALRNCFTTDAQLISYIVDPNGLPVSRNETVLDFINQVGAMKNTAMEEKRTGWQCFIDDGIASVWTPYEFYFENKFSHCGVNSFQLMKVQGDWKITQITDTRRRRDCIDDTQEIQVIDSLINEWHHAAEIADEQSFFGRMSAEAIYIGTDASERWLRDELKEWSSKYFERESAWAFKPLGRNVTVAQGGQLAWFDELLDTWMGPCRSTGIMKKYDHEWKLIHYQLSVAVPNEKLDEYRKLIGKI